MESIARALDVGKKDPLEFAHLLVDRVKVEEIEKLLEGADEEKKRTIMKIVRTVMRCNKVKRKLNRKPVKA